ncbi:MAG TPA: SDR family oxidoreductase [Candidatus Acidoferrum sp.]|nr:SDR family oxidoreductase [Candidatus Acidoferrum sp.]
MKIIISGASGDLGRKITANLLQRVAAADLILLTRNPASLADAAKLGASVRKADFNDAAALTKALDGGDVLMLISTLSIGKRVQQHTTAINAAKAAGIRHVVYTSSCGIQPQTPSISGQEHYATEQVLQKSGLDFTILRNSWYADVIPQLLMPAAIAMGAIGFATGNGRVAPVAKDDCARAAAAVLADYRNHAGAIYEITGPELFTLKEMMAYCSTVSRKPIVYQDMSREEKQAVFDAMGVNREYQEGMMNDTTNAWASDEMITYEMAIRHGFFSLCSRHVEMLTGKPATEFSEVVEMHRASWSR